MKRKLLGLPILLFFASTSFTQSIGKVVLNKGQKFIQEATGNILVSQEMMGQQMQSKIDISSTNTLEVTNVKDTSYSLTNTITKMKMNMSAMGQDMSYDSDREDNDSMMSNSMGKMINDPQSFEISPMGKLISKSDTTSELTNNDMMSGLQNVLGNSDAFLAMPLKAKAGYSWVDSVDKDGSRSNMTYTIKELRGNDATVSVKGAMQMSQKAEAQNVEFTNNSTGAISGELVIDAKTGIIKQRNTAIETTGTVEVMGQQIPMTTKTTSQTTLRSAD